MKRATREQYESFIETASKIEEETERREENDFMDWLFNERRGDALKLYAQYARKITKEDKA